MVSLAYLDPGNCEYPSLSLSLPNTHISNILFQTEIVETDLQAGANHRYEVHYQSKAQRFSLSSLSRFKPFPPFATHLLGKILFLLVPEDSKKENLTECLSNFLVLTVFPFPSAPLGDSHWSHLRTYHTIACS
jgi:hypothetical protein